MAKSLFEKLSGKYERQGDYLIPCIALLTEEEQPIGTWGMKQSQGKRTAKGRKCRLSNFLIDKFIFIY